MALVPTGTRYRGVGISGTGTKTTTTDIDFKFTYDSLIDGGQVILEDHVFSDKITIQIVDVDNILGYGAGTVLNEFLTDWYVDPGTCAQYPLALDYTAKVKKDLYLRVKYVSVGTVNDVKIRLNLSRHKLPD